MSSPLAGKRDIVVTIFSSPGQSPGRAIVLPPASALHWRSVGGGFGVFYVMGKASYPVPVTGLVVQCMCASVRICPDRNLYNNAWILKQFGTVVALEEEKCCLKHFLR